jgi:type IV secretory pathway TrbD component
VVRRALSLSALTGLAVTVVIVAAKPAGWYDHLWPNDAGAAISTATRDPASRVFASDKYADWLLWRHPKLAGRVAFDIRFELNSRAQVRRLSDYFGRIGPNWQAAARGYQVIVLDRHAHNRVRLALRRDPRIRQAYLSHDLAVLVRTGKAGK